ncbi:MAG: DUF2490 domain-containing protein [Vicinamibacterales bacterium]
MRRRHHSPAALRPSARGWTALVVLGLLLGPAEAARAQGSPDAQLWFQTLALGQIAEAWRAHLEVQPRVFDSASELGLTIVRGAVGRQLGARSVLWAGYAWVPRTFGPGLRHETRIWQQFTASAPPVAGWTASTRLRLEQRRLDPWDGTSHRLRILGRAQRRFGASPWGFGLYNETMLTLDDTARGPERGFDRNRFYTGVLRQISPELSTELGYIWERASTGGPGRRHDHALMGVVNIAFAVR